MSGISHKQAIQLIHRRLDGLLNEIQLLSLDEHLQSCDECRAYASEMDLLPMHLRHEFHTRWDKNPGPSQNVIEHVTTKARNIPMTNRFSSSVKLFAGAIAMLILGIAMNFVISQLHNTSPAAIETETVNNSSQNNEGLIAFAATSENGDLDIYTIHPYGSGLTNLTNDTEGDATPVWSPDGRYIAFVSNRDGNENIYVMNADGSNLTRLTDDPASDNTPVWSPDGTKIAYTSGNFYLDNTNLYVMDADGQNRHRVTNYASKMIIFPKAWSRDGQYIFFNIRGQISKVNLNSGDVTAIVPQTDASNQFVLSKDDSKLQYLVDCNQNIYDFCNRVKTINWDGTNGKTLSTMKIAEMCPVKQTSTWMGSYTKWSPDQTKMLFAFTCEENGWLYIANADGSDFKPLTNYPILGNGPQNEVVTFDWSPDSQSIVFMSALGSPESESLYILNVNDALQNPELRPIGLNTSTTQVSSPAWQPTP